MDTAVQKQEVRTRAPATLSNLPPTAQHRRLAVLIVIGLLLVLGAAVPFANTPLQRIVSFVPVLFAVIFVTDLITSVLLFGYFLMDGARAMLVLASGYLFSSLVIIPYVLTFPPEPYLGAGTQSSAWLNVFRHFGFIVAVLGYVYLKNIGMKEPPRPPALFTIYKSVMIVIGIVCVLTWVVTVEDKLTPMLFLMNLS
jgi:hypothetical protein